MKRYVKELAEDRLADCEKILANCNPTENLAVFTETVICREKIKKALEDCESGAISDYMAVQAIIEA